MRSKTTFAGFLIAVLLGLSSIVTAQETIKYGPEPTSFGEFTIPIGVGPFPVVVFIHGGCYRADLGSTAGYRPMASELAADGVAAWNLEYRRIGHDGGGWPGTFLDLGNGLNYLNELSESFPIDLNRVVVVGHSSGGHFAAWLATRSQLPERSEIYTEPIVTPFGVVITDAFIIPEIIDSIGVDGSIYCREPMLERLVGGRPDSHPQNLKEISPLEWLPWGVPQEYVVSTRRYPVSLPRPLADGRTTMRIPDYPALAVVAGDSIHVQVINDADHVGPRGFYQPGEESYSATVLAIKRLLSVNR